MWTNLLDIQYVIGLHFPVWTPVLVTLHIDLAINFKARVFSYQLPLSQPGLSRTRVWSRVEFPFNLTDDKDKDKDTSLSTVVVSSRPSSFFDAHATIVFWSKAISQPGIKRNSEEETLKTGSVWFKGTDNNSFRENWRQKNERQNWQFLLHISAIIPIWISDMLRCVVATLLHAWPKFLYAPASFYGDYITKGKKSTLTFDRN